jgi:hypothetical protein
MIKGGQERRDARELASNPTFAEHARGARVAGACRTGHGPTRQQAPSAAGPGQEVFFSRPCRLKRSLAVRPQPTTAASNLPRTEVK